MNQKEKYALVTGASSGIGRHISIELAQQGYSIIAVSNQPEQLNILKKELEAAFGISVHPLNIIFPVGRPEEEFLTFAKQNGMLLKQRCW